MNALRQHNQNTGNEDRQWVQVTETFGVTQTEMIIEYLRDNGIHAVAIESRAMGMITGANSIARVMVPEEDVGPALDLLEPEDNIDREDDSVDASDDASSISSIDKAVLGATAIAFNPLGVGIAYALSRSISSDEDNTVNNLVDCPKCWTSLELSDDELEQGWFTCPECDQVTRLDDLVVCPSCQSELELDAEEQSRGWYICPECRWAVRINQS